MTVNVNDKITGISGSGSGGGAGGGAPSNSSMYAYVSLLNVADRFIAANGPKIVLYNNVISDVNAMYNAATGGFTIPSNGTYRIQARHNAAPHNNTIGFVNWTAAEVFQTSVKVNGLNKDSLVHNELSIFNGTQTFINIQHTAILNLVAGDIVKFEHASAETQHILNADAVTQEGSLLIEKVM